MAGITWFDGEWIDADAPMISVNSQGVWLSSFVFDGARAFENVAPDLDLHCQRAIDSARRFNLKPSQTVQQICDLAWEGIERFPAGAELYIRPMYWAEKGWVAPDPDSTTFALSVMENPLPPESGFSAHVARERRPNPDMAPTDSKAACLYPNAARALQSARDKGFDNAVILDPIGNVAEFATANLWMAKNGVVRTPAPNGTFLNGITRQRVLSLFREAGVEVREGRITVDDLHDADEIFNTGNYGKVMHVNRFEGRDLQPGPFYKRAREMYWNYSHRHGTR